MPPPADTRVEPVYQEYNYQGLDILIETALNTGEGKLYHEVELPRRPYSDVEAEMANQLSILFDRQAWCRLIHDPGSRGEKGEKQNPRLVEFRIETEKKGEGEANPEIKEYIRERSRKMAPTREEVEADILSRTQVEIEPEETPLAEKIAKRKR